MIWAVVIVFGTVVVRAEAQNVETRIHRRISPQNNSGISFGASLSSHESSKNLIIGAPTNAAGLAYSCGFLYDGNRSTELKCSRLVNGAKSIGLGISISKLALTGGNDLVLICSNQYLFTCPNRSIEQRMIGECYSINSVTNKAVKLRTPCPTECPKSSKIIADIVFLVDGSGSVKLSNFRIGLEWITQVLSRFSDAINQTDVQVGYVLFNHEIYRTSPPSPKSFEVLKAEFESKKTDYSGGGTFTNDAINSGNRLLSNSRKDVPKVMVTITDGVSYYRDRTKSAAAKAREAGIVMIAVGIGSKVNADELRSIATGITSSPERVLSVGSYGKLETILEDLSKLITETALTSLEGEFSNSTNELTNCQFGNSISATRDGVFVGAPGSYDRVGTVVEFGLNEFPEVASSGHLNDTELSSIVGLSTKDLKDAYFGYSTGAGRLQTGNKTWIVTGGPRYLSRGAVLAHDIGNQSNYTIIHPTNTSGYWQLGGYYGHSVLATDLNRDGFDDLLVAEPLYSQIAGYDEGIVFVYMNDKSASSVINWASHKHDVIHLRGSSVSSARFGMSIVDAGDIDQNGYNDVIIGAPNEKLFELDSASGAIYIYFASQMGLDITNVQRIDGKSLRSSTPLKGFGWALHTGSDFDNNSYPDIAVAAPSSDSVILLRTRKLIDATLTLIVSSKEMDVVTCARSPSVACINATTCFSAQYRGLKTSDTFPMIYNVTTDYLIASSTFRRLIFLSTKTDVAPTREISVGNASHCVTYGIQFNFEALGKIYSGGFQASSRLKFQADLSPAYKNRVMSGMLSPSSQQVHTADLSFEKGCKGSGGRCNHDLQITAKYSIPMTGKPLKLDGSSTTLQINYTVTNIGPDYAFFLKVNISSGNLTINRVVSSCMIISEDEGSPGQGVTVLKYQQIGSTLKDLMMADSKCDFQVYFDFARLQLLAISPEVHVRGKVYSNAGENNQTFDTNTGNNEFLYRKKVQYQSNLVLSTESVPESVFFHPSNNNNSVKTVKTLDDNIFGGNVSNFFHRYNVYNSGPLRLVASRMKITWPEKTKDGHDLLYLVDVYCEPACNCMTEGIANKYAIAPNEESRKPGFKEFTLSYPDTSEAIRSSDKLTCSNTQCNEVYCDVGLVDRFRQVAVFAIFKAWTITFGAQFTITDIETSLKIIPSSVAAPLSLDNVTAFSTLLSLDREIPPPPSRTHPLDIGAVIGAIFGGLALLAIAAGLMWKFGFFESKYGNMTREARRTIRERSPESSNSDIQDNLEASQEYKSTTDVVDG